MRSLPLAILVAATVCLSAVPARAQGKVYPWCAYYDVWTYNCGFDTLAQCRATISGVGGVCRPNPYAPPPARRR